MKRLQKVLNYILTISCFFSLLVINAGCGNSSADKNETENRETKDTTIRQDTINVDPENFSDPH